MAIAKKNEEYNKKESGELGKALKEKERQLIEANMSAAQRKIKNVHSSRNIRKEIARIKTAIKFKSIEG